MHFVGGNPSPKLEGLEELPGRVNYFIGNDPQKWLTNIPTYAKVRYANVYPGVDVVYYGNAQRLEYDFVVRPGADPGAITLGFDGERKLHRDANGDLLVNTAGGTEVRQQKPRVYQEWNGIQREIGGSYEIRGPGQVGFQIAAYDAGHILVIDPVLTYSTYLGGGNGDDEGRGIAVDSEGNVYVAGSTNSTNFPTASPLQGTSGSGDLAQEFSDVFIAKLNSAGTALLFSTYLGGLSDDDGNGIAIDPGRNIYVTGSTTSSNFPTTGGAFRTVCTPGAAGCQDAFVAKLNPTGSALVFSTFLGGNGEDGGRAIVVDSGSNVYVAGRTTSTDFPTTLGPFQTDSSLGAFTTKLSTTGALVYSTYVGTAGGTNEVRGIAVDSAGNAYITGSSTAPPASGTDAFVMKLSASGTAALYSTFVRGARDEIGNAIAIDSAGNAYVTGQTASIDFPTTAGSVQTAFGGGPVFKSSDAGAAWTMTSAGITRSSVFALAVVPSNPSMIYAGASDDTSGGIFRSTDGGTTWSTVNDGLADTRVHALAIDPANPSTLYAGSRSSGVFKSTNGGTSWSVTGLANAFVISFAIDPATPTTIYAGTDGLGVFKSTNRGDTWTAVNTGLSSTAAVRSIIIDPVTPPTLYAGTSGGVFKSTNGGSSWSGINSGLIDANINALAIDPRNPATLYAATNLVGIFKTINGGGFWNAANSGLTSTSLGLFASALIVDSASPTTLYAAIGESNSNRVYKSTNSGASWSATSLTSVRVTALAVSATSPATVYAGTIGGADAFVAKFNSAGAVVYSTYLGGTRDEVGNGIAVDSAGNAYVIGSSSSVNFPSVSPLQAAFGGGVDVVLDAFVTKVSPAGNAIAYSTYLGGAGNEIGNAIAVDSAGNAYVAGSTGSSDFPTARPVQTSQPGLNDTFVSKISETGTISLSFSITNRGGMSRATQGGAGSPIVGYARIQPSAGNTTPSGLAIFGFRQNNILVTEAAVPASPLIQSGRIYAEVGGAVNTGLAIANPNSQPATINFFLTNANGADFGAGSTTIPAGGQIAAFLNQSPFNSGPSASGTFTFNANVPIAAIALRGFTNERSEFLITTLPISGLTAPVAETILFPHFADAGGWTTQIVLVNPADEATSGSVQFFSAGSASAPGQPSTLTVDRQAGSTFSYTIPARSSRRLQTSGSGPTTQSGSVRVVPSSNNRTPSGLVIFSYRSGGITVSEAGVPAIRAGSAFRLYAEASGNFPSGQIGSIQTGVALANSATSPVNVNFELTRLDGTSLGLTGSAVVPATGQMARFLNEIQGFESLALPFQGVLRISSASSAIAVIGLRARYNERGSFLITTTPPIDEAGPATSLELLFPHLVEAGGYTTQFILFSGLPGQSASGALRFFGQFGQTLNLTLR